MKKYIYILIAILMMLPAELPAQQRNGKPTAAQVQREKAAAKRAKEKAKRDKERAKAQAKRDKERAKAQAARDKEAAKRQAERDKAAAAKQKEADQKAKEAEKVAAAKEKEAEKAAAAKEKEAEKAEKAAPVVDERAQQAEQRAKEAEARAAAKAKEADRKVVEKQKEQDRKAWEKEKELARKKGDKTWYTKTRDVHYINFYGGVGYSSLLSNYGQQDSPWGGVNAPARVPAQSVLNPNGVEFNGTFRNRALGGVGGLIGVAYELRHERFLFNIGPEFRILSTTDAMDFKAVEGATDAFIAAHPAYNTMTQYYRFSPFTETTVVGQIMAPIMFGGDFGTFYFLVGPKVGFTLVGAYAQGGKLHTWVRDEAALNPSWNQLYNHYDVNTGLNSNGLYAGGGKGNNAFGLDITASAELGINLDDYMPAEWAERNENSPKPWHFRIAAFVDYGVWNMNVQHKDADGNPDKLLVAGGDIAMDEVGFPVKTIATNSVHQSSFANGRLNSLLVGVKFTARLQLTKPKLPDPYLEVVVRDAFTNQPIRSAKVSVHQVGSKRRPQQRAVKMTAKLPGIMQQRYAVGEYEIWASAPDYIESAPIVFEHLENRNRPDTIRLIPIPKLTFYVHDANDERLIGAKAYFKNDRTQEVTEVTTPPGVVKLQYGDTYHVRVEADGYHPDSTVVVDLYATEHWNLRPIVRVRRVLVLKNMYFAVDKTDILPESEEEINKLYTFLVENPKIRVLITGHTDSDGSEKHNQVLSEGRAESLKKEMVARGIAEDRMETNGKGESEPIDTNDTAEGKQNNRRIEVTVLNADEATEDIY